MKNRTKNWIFLSAFLVGLAGFVVGMVMKDSIPHVRLVFIAAFLLLESRILYGFFETLLRDRSVGEELLVIVASAITIALGDYPESLSLVVMYMIGEYIIHLIEKNNCPDEGDHTECCCHPHSRKARGVLSFVRYYIVAVLAGIVIVLFLSLFMDILHEDSILKTLAILLLIACPCTLFISTPLCKYYAVKALNRAGIHLRDLDDLDEASKAKTPEEAKRHFDGSENPDFAYAIAKRYKSKVIQNICVIIAAKIAFMILSVYFQNTIIAVAADLVIALLVFANSVILARRRPGNGQ